MEKTSSLLPRRYRLPIALGLFALAATVFYPLMFILITSLRTNEDYLQGPFSLPDGVTFYNYLVLLNDYGVGSAFLRTTAVATISVVIEITLATLAGYALAKYDVPGGKIMTSTFVAVLLIPGQVLIIPIYLMLSKLGLIGDYPGLILVYVATGLPFSVFFMMLSFRSLPGEVLEAARMDGAGFVRTFSSVVVPMGIASVTTIFVLQFLGKWNELLFALILLPDDKNLLTPALAEIGDRYLTNQPLVSAGLLVTGIVPILLLVFASRYIMQGMQVGAK